MKIPDLLRKAVNKLVVSQTFFSQPFFAIPNEISDMVPTAGTTGVKRYFNPEFMATLNVDEQLFVIVHEVLHDALDHQGRCGSRHKMLWNAACDFKINALIKELGNLPLCKIALYDPKYDENWSEELIYDDLLKNAKKIELTMVDILDPTGEGEGEDGESPSTSNGKKGVGATPEEIKEAKNKIREALVQAKALSKQFGNLSAGLERAIQNVLYPKQQWFEYLSRFFNTISYDDYDWTKINRRELSRTGFITPRMYNERVGHVLIAIDCSGSISEDILGEFQGHTNDCLSAVSPKKTSVVYFDTRELKKEEFTSDELPVKLTPIGGGGTCFRWLSNWNSENIDVCVFLTDGYGSFPLAGEVDYPVIWCLNHDQKIEVPFGEVLNMR